MHLNLREEVLKTSLLAEESGLCHHGGGNFSMIDRKSGVVAITPHGASRKELCPKDIILVDLDGCIVEKSDGMRPTSEVTIHLTIYNKLSMVGAVCHTHAEFASVFAGLSTAIKPVLTEAMLYGVKCPVAPFATPGTQDLADNIANTLCQEDTQAVLMEKHGLLTVGNNIYDAYLKSMYVEEVAKAYYRMANLVGLEKVQQCLKDEEFDYMMNELGIKA
jgi:L-fuculose-phosphate aldolase